VTLGINGERLWASLNRGHGTGWLQSSGAIRLRAE
jgi:hypothetical protein